MTHQIDCFKIQFTFFKYTSIRYCKTNHFRYYDIYYKVFLFIFVILHCFLFTINFGFIGKKLDLIIEELVLWLTTVNVVSKVFTFVILHENIEKILEVLESEGFQPKSESGMTILKKAKEMNVLLWKIFTGSSLTSHVAHALIPVILHFALGMELHLPVCSYAFLSNTLKEKLLYPLYLYQWLGIQVVMWHTINIDSFFLGLMNLIIVQLDILDHNLRQITDVKINEELGKNEEEVCMKLKECVLHYSRIVDVCQLVQGTFSVTLFAQFNIASYIICVCLFRLTLPLTTAYLVFLIMYIIVMVMQILIPCWFGHQIYDKSSQLPAAIYMCAWAERPRRFTSSMRLFVERASQPLAIKGGKIFPLLLTTFTSIANSAYTFYNLLRSVQSKE